MSSRILFPTESPQLNYHLIFTYINYLVKNYFSKASRGLLFPHRLIGLFTNISISSNFRLRQQKSRWMIPWTPIKSRGLRYIKPRGAVYL